MDTKNLLQLAFTIFLCGTISFTDSTLKSHMGLSEWRNLASERKWFEEEYSPKLFKKKYVLMDGRINTYPDGTKVYSIRCTIQKGTKHFYNNLKNLQMLVLSWRKRDGGIKRYIAGHYLERQKKLGGANFNWEYRSKWKKYPIMQSAIDIHSGYIHVGGNIGYDSLNVNLPVNECEKLTGQFECEAMATPKRGKKMLHAADVFTFPEIDNKVSSSCGNKLKKSAAEEAAILAFSKKKHTLSNEYMDKVKDYYMTSRKGGDNTPERVERRKFWVQVDGNVLKFQKHSVLELTGWLAKKTKKECKSVDRFYVFYEPRNVGLRSVQYLLVGLIRDKAMWAESYNFRNFPVLQKAIRANMWEGNLGSVGAKFKVAIQVDKCEKLEGKFFFEVFCPRRSIKKKDVFEGFYEIQPDNEISKLSQSCKAKSEKIAKLEAEQKKINSLNVTMSNTGKKHGKRLNKKYKTGQHKGQKDSVRVEKAKGNSEDGGDNTVLIVVVVLLLVVLVAGGGILFVMCKKKQNDSSEETKPILDQEERSSPNEKDDKREEAKERRSRRRKRDRSEDREKRRHRKRKENTEDAEDKGDEQNNSSLHHQYPPVRSSISRKGSVPYPHHYLSPNQPHRTGVDNNYRDLYRQHQPRESFHHLVEMDRYFYKPQEYGAVRTYDQQQDSVYTNTLKEYRSRHTSADNIRGRQMYRQTGDNSQTGAVVHDEDSLRYIPNDNQRFQVASELYGLDRSPYRANRKPEFITPQYKVTQKKKYRIEKSKTDQQQTESIQNVSNGLTNLNRQTIVSNPKAAHGTTLQDQQQNTLSDSDTFANKVQPYSVKEPLNIVQHDVSKIKFQLQNHQSPSYQVATSSTLLPRKVQDDSQVCNEFNIVPEKENALVSSSVNHVPENFTTSRKVLESSQMSGISSNKSENTERSFKSQNLEKVSSAPRTGQTSLNLTTETGHNQSELHTSPNIHLDHAPPSSHLESPVSAVKASPDQWVLDSKTSIQSNLSSTLARRRNIVAPSLITINSQASSSSDGNVES